MSGLQNHIVLAWNWLEQLQLRLKTIRSYLYTKLNYIICHIDLPHAITLNKGIFEMLNLISLEQ